MMGDSKAVLSAAVGDPASEGASEGGSNGEALVNTHEATFVALQEEHRRRCEGAMANATRLTATWNSLMEVPSSSVGAQVGGCGPAATSVASDTSGHPSSLFQLHLGLAIAGILVGQESKPYHVHSELLEQKSPYFQTRAALLSKVQAQSTAVQAQGVGKTKVVHWEETTNCEVFNLLLEYLYTDEFTAPSRDSVAKKCETYAQLYRLADLLTMNDLKAVTLTKLATLLRENLLGDRALKPAEIISLLDIAYADNISEGASTAQVEAVDIVQQDDSILPEERATVSSEHEFAGHSKSGMLPGSPDPLQGLIARYAAVKLESLQKNSAFAQIVLDDGYMVLDIMMAVRPAYGID